MLHSSEPGLNKTASFHGADISVTGSTVPGTARYSRAVWATDTLCADDTELLRPSPLPTTQDVPVLGG